jgi:hypothetical protein
MSDTNYEALVQCYLSEQMTLDQLYKHFDEDPGFEIWFMERMNERSYAGTA